MIGFFVILTIALTLAALYITGVIKPPLLAKTLASLAFVALGAYALFVPGGRVWADLSASTEAAASSEAGLVFTPFRILLFCGLCFGSLGDVLLELFDEKDKRFFLGVGAFFIGHALYVASYFQIDAGSAWIALLCAFPITALLTILSARLLTFEGARRVLLLTYMFALSFMCSFAWVILIRRGLAPFRLIAPGAILFLLSDSSLGLQMFGNEKLANHRRLLGAICLITYYLAQNLIASSLAF